MSYKHDLLISTRALQRCLECNPNVLVDSLEPPPAVLGEGDGVATAWPSLLNNNQLVTCHLGPVGAWVEPGEPGKNKQTSH